ncbi:hypothetical protein [Leifsonia sp. 21MFCrub1.1]|uniref:hypothetical protein n=1 Tax=Leifsonia sp. 21MFCrub1.1 TaxID=1798223 RepID=UPI0008928A7A|nr:hypothetical protein [Leifsonia sp. 21MFCrub1.1]SEA78421.1 hypothetical protein SAMN04515680_1535 [Leifsonia sp. 21MFCrub1.1]
MRAPTLRSAITSAALALVVGGSLVAAAPATAVTQRVDATSPTSAISGMWAWGNPIDPAEDARGEGLPQFEPQALAEFAAAHHLRTVFLSVPWAADEGPFGVWLTDAVDALHAAGVTKVAALGGDPAWAGDPSLAATWTSAALRAAPFDAVQFDVEPWVVSSDDELPAVVAQLQAMYDAARTAAGSVPIGADLPWWLAAKPQPGGGTAFDALLPHLKSVAIVAFSDHAAGTDGIVALAKPAATAAAAKRIPFSIGVETDTPEVAGGPAATFGDDSAALLEAETAKVRTALGGLRGYGGVTVEHLLSWQTLLAP